MPPEATQALIAALVAPEPVVIKRNPHATPRVTVGLLTWNPGPEALQAFNAVFEQDEAAFAVSWVDNHSAPENLAPLRAVNPFPTPVINPRNIGFCGGHNQLIAACRTPFYLALNQDALLPPDYLRRMCDWLEAEPQLAMASGVILNDSTPPRVQAAGLAYPRNRASFLPALDEPLAVLEGGRHFTSGVMGPAMLLRLAACRDVSDSPAEIFPDDFFAYHEELDLAQRLGRAGYRCGVDQDLFVRHGGASSGGRRSLFIEEKFFANHWLLSARHDSLGLLLRELPWIAWGELRWWSLHYKAAPRAFFPALVQFLRRLPAARRFYRKFEQRHGPTQARLSALRRMAGSELAHFQAKQDARKRAGHAAQ